MNPTRLAGLPVSILRQLCLTLVLGVLVGPLAVSAQVEASAAGRSGGWKSVGPAPPTIAAPIAVSPNSRRIYINSMGGGLFRSRNGGSTFVAMETSVRGYSSLAVDPRDPNVVYVGFYKSIDGGETWTEMPGGGQLGLIMDPGNPDVLYGVGGDILKTTDAGETWFPATDGVSASISLAIDPFDTDVLYAGTRGGGAFKSVDGGVVWSPLDIDSTVWSLLVDPGNGNVVYAGTDGNGVYRSIDGGASFAPIGSPRTGIVFALAKSGDRLYAATDVGGVSVSRDGGRTWKDAGVAEGRALALSTDSAGAVYLSTNFEGAFVRPASDHDDGRFENAADARDGEGRKWKRLGWKTLGNCACQDSGGISIDPSNHERLLLGADAGLLVSEDGGRSWQDGNRHGMPRGAGGGVFDPQQPRRVYIGSNGLGFLKSVDHGKHWVRRDFGVGNQNIVGVAVDPVDHSVYAGTVFADGLWKSTDFGDTFTRIDRAPGAPPDEFLNFSGRGITVDPHNHDTVYFTDRSTGTWRSQDAGASWVNVDPHPAQNATVDPTDSSIVYVGSFFLVLKSVDGGASFVPKSNGLPEQLFVPVAGGVRVDPSHHDVLYVGATFDGVFKSIDGAETWFPVSMGLEGVTIGGLTLDPVNPKVLYAGTSGSVYKTRTGGE